jgi:hypothetical protein
MSSLDDVTVIVHTALYPLEVLAVMVAVPAEIAVTVPFLTVATLVSLEVHVTVLLVAFDGRTVAVRELVLPALSVRADELSVMLVGLTFVPVPPVVMAVPLTYRL